MGSKNESMETETNHTITRYLEGRMSPAEQEAFERRLESDPELLGQMENHELVISMHRRLRSVATEKTLSGIREESEAKNLEVVHRGQRSRRILYWAVAASVLAAAVYFTWFDNPILGDDRIYAMLSELSPADAVQKSGTAADFDQAYRAYLDGDYAESSQLFSELVTSDETNLLNRMWLGMSQMQEKEYEKALQSFESSRLDEFLYRDRVQLLKAISLIKLDKDIEARAILNQLIDEGSDYAGEARKLLKYAKP